MAIIQGDYIVDKSAKVAIIVARFNEFIVKKLLDGALDCLDRHGLNEKSVSVYWVPGSFEIPATARKLAENGKYHAIICLGAVIRGDTPHFEYVSSEVSKGIANVSQQTGKPVIYGVLTTDTIEQAMERAGTKAGNRGFDAAMDALEMISLNKKIDSE